MTVKYGKFELPTKVKVEEDEDSSRLARIIAGPFERGFGHTIGNSIRRIMLTALEAPAIVSVLIEGISHEYMASEGIVEDMTHIILNIKESLLRRLPTGDDAQARAVKTISKELEVTQDMLASGDGSYQVKLGDIIEDARETSNVFVSMPSDEAGLSRKSTFITTAPLSFPGDPSKHSMSPDLCTYI